MAQTENYKALSKVKTKANKIEKSIIEFQAALKESLELNINYLDFKENEKKLMDEIDSIIDRIDKTWDEKLDI